MCDLRVNLKVIIVSILCKVLKMSIYKKVCSIYYLLLLIIYSDIKYLIKPRLHTSTQPKRSATKLLQAQKLQNKKNRKKAPGPQIHIPKAARPAFGKTPGFHHRIRPQNPKTRVTWRNGRLVFLQSAQVFFGSFEDHGHGRRSANF